MSCSKTRRSPGKDDRHAGCFGRRRDHRALAGRGQGHPHHLCDVSQRIITGSCMPALNCRSTLPSTVDVESCLYTTMRVSPQNMHTYGGIFASKNKSTQIHTADTFLKFAHTNLRVKKNSKNIAEDQGQSELHTMSSMSEFSQAQSTETVNSRAVLSRVRPRYRHLL